MNEEEKKVGLVVKEILDAVSMNWSANLRSGEQVVSIVEKGGLTDVSVLEESHHIHPLIMAHKK